MIKEARFCPWHQQDEADHYCCAHPTVHLIGTDRGSGEVNVGYIAPLPLHSQLIFFHIVPLKVTSGDVTQKEVYTRVSIQVSH